MAVDGLDSHGSSSHGSSLSSGCGVVWSGTRRRRAEILHTTIQVGMDG